MKHKNLTIQNLPELITDSALKSAVKAGVDCAWEATAFCRDWRNRSIAHFDHELMTDVNARPLEDANRELVNRSLALISAVMNLLSGHYFESDFNGIWMDPQGGAVELLYIIDDGLRIDIERQSRLESGFFNQNDTVPRDL